MPLEKLLIQAQEAFAEGNGLQGFVDSGGLGFIDYDCWHDLPASCLSCTDLAYAHGDLRQKTYLFPAPMSMPRCG